MRCGVLAVVGIGVLLPLRLLVVAPMGELCGSAESCSSASCNVRDALVLTAVAVLLPLSAELNGLSGQPARADQRRRTQPLQVDRIELERDPPPRGLRAAPRAAPASDRGDADAWRCWTTTAPAPSPRVHSRRFAAAATNSGQHIAALTASGGTASCCCNRRTSPRHCALCARAGCWSL